MLAKVTVVKIRVNYGTSVCEYIGGDAGCIRIYIYIYTYATASPPMYHN